MRVHTTHDMCLVATKHAAALCCPSPIHSHIKCYITVAKQFLFLTGPSSSSSFTPCWQKFTPGRRALKIHQGCQDDDAISVLTTEATPNLTFSAARSRSRKMSSRAFSGSRHWRNADTPQPKIDRLRDSLLSLLVYYTQTVSDASFSAVVASMNGPLRTYVG